MPALRGVTMVWGVSKTSKNSMKYYIDDSLFKANHPATLSVEVARYLQLFEE